MVDSFAITGSTEILHVADSVAREKGIPKESVMLALRDAIETVARRKYGHEQNIRAEINEKLGEITLYRDRAVVETVENPGAEITLEDAKEEKADAEIGNVISEPLPPIDFGRVVSQTFKQVLIQRIREAEREKQYEDFKDRVGEIVTGVVKRIEYGNLIIDFGKTETMLMRDQTIPREVFRQGDRIRAYIVDVRRENRGPQIFLSRTHPDFLAQLFAQEVPEIYDNLVKIKAVARDPGSRAKIAVVSEDSSIDPVGACIGPRGSRVTAVYNELQGEKIDIIQWSPDLATLAVNALASKTKETQVEVSKIIIDEDKHKIEAVVPDEQLSMAIGRRGQNVRLAAELIEWNIDVMSETEDSERSLEEFNRLSAMFAEQLNVEEVIGQLLASEGFTSMEEVAYVDKSELLSIEGFEEELVDELRQRAEEVIEEQKAELKEEIKALGVQDDLKEFADIDDDILVEMAKKGVKSLDDLADLSSDEFLEMFPDIGLTHEQADDLIMQARAHWFEDEEPENDNTDEAEPQEVASS